MSTNGEVIRRLSDEELARFIKSCVAECTTCPVGTACPGMRYVDCTKVISEWLTRNFSATQEAKDAETD